MSPSYEDYRRYGHGRIIAWTISSPWWLWFVLIPAAGGGLIAWLS